MKWTITVVACTGKNCNVVNHAKSQSHTFINNNNNSNNENGFHSWEGIVRFALLHSSPIIRIYDVKCWIHTHITHSVLWFYRAPFLSAFLSLFVFIISLLSNSERSAALWKRVREVKQNAKSQKAKFESTNAIGEKLSAKHAKKTVMFFSPLSCLFIRFLVIIKTVRQCWFKNKHTAKRRIIIL